MGFLYNINIKEHSSFCSEAAVAKKEFEKICLKNVVVSRPEDICPFESDGLVRNIDKRM